MYVLVKEIKQFTGQRKLREVFRRGGPGIFKHRKNLRAGIHPVNTFVFDRQKLPDMLTHTRRFVVEHFRKHRFSGGDKGKFDLTTIWFHKAILKLSRIGLSTADTLDEAVNGPQDIFFGRIGEWCRQCTPQQRGATL